MKKVQLAKVHLCPVCVKPTYGAIEYTSSYKRLICLECHKHFTIGDAFPLRNYDLDKTLCNPSRRDNK